MVFPLADQELSAWLRLTLTPGVGGESQRALLANFGLPAQVFAAGRAALTAVLTGKQVDALLGDEAGEAVASALAWAAEPGNHLVTLADPDYPQRLLEIPPPPPPR